MLTKFTKLIPLLTFRYSLILPPVKRLPIFPILCVCLSVCLCAYVQSVSNKLWMDFAVTTCGCCTMTFTYCSNNANVVIKGTKFINFWQKMTVHFLQTIKFLLLIFSTTFLLWCFSYRIGFNLMYIFFWKQNFRWHHNYISSTEWGKFSVLVKWRIRMIRTENYENIGNLLKVWIDKPTCYCKQ